MSGKYKTICTNIKLEIFVTRLNDWSNPILFGQMRFSTVSLSRSRENASQAVRLLFIDSLFFIPSPSCQFHLPSLCDFVSSSSFSPLYLQTHHAFDISAPSHHPYFPSFQNRGVVNVNSLYSPCFQRKRSRQG